MHVTQVAIGRFHHFHLARQLHRRGLLDAIWTGYPRRALRDEKELDPALIRSFARYMVVERLLPRVPLLRRFHRLEREIGWRHLQGIDKAAARSLRGPTVLVGLSSAGLNAGRRAQALGGRFVCDRGSSHIAFQRDILVEEHRRWGLEPPWFDPRVVAKEEAEYEAADRVTVPSSFARATFIERGVPAEKVVLLPYGARLDRFRPAGEPQPDRFTLLYVGRVSLRKGIPYLLQAFARLRHPGKRLRIAGLVDDDMGPVLRRLPLGGVEFLGSVSNAQLVMHYSAADAALLPSIEDGFGMVLGEALACGCPVVASTNTGSSDLVTDGVEGRIVPVRDADALARALQDLADDPHGRRAMRAAALARVERIGGWDDYGRAWAALVEAIAR